MTNTRYARCFRINAVSTGVAVNIRFTSSLTPEDENLLAPALLKALAAILELLPIAYSIRIETCDSHTYHHTGTAGPLPTADTLDDAYVDRAEVV